ncbi:DUF4382 domain-containing protein [Ralstonia solanacearum]|uniref:DUF4382 domain-containing protein n=1 Tax=Ralstonia solanacearum TaxID=305 RepID=UPI0007C88659|nr:DUF4382 domain-containing protein [Ralstonia solanacearum]OAI75319.1 lipoprotein [Ralstonia solanacearum]RCW11683.1 hypothetical protein RSP816_09485 [Ralstonia solanacearum]
MRISLKALAGVLAAPFLITACGGGSDGGGAGTGTLHVSMTDAPACGFDHAYITVSKVRVHMSAQASDTDAGWTDVALAAPQKVDLLSLTNGVLSDLGQSALPTGQYQQVRLVLVANQGNTLANSVVPTGGTEQALDTPSATQSGIKIIQPFTVQPNTLVDLVLDFNACRSIVQRGNGTYSLKPVVSATPTVVSGTISGFVAPAEAGATVLAEQNGQVIRGTVADSNGQFVLSPLVQSSTNGNYDVVVVQTNRASGIVQSVPVTVSGTTIVSTSAAPITLPASTMHTASGTVTPASATATLRALQTIGSLRYEIGATNANLDTGAYSLSLPAAAPMIGAYSGTLPVSLSTATSVAGVYTIEADAASGATQSTGVNLSTADQANVNFAF